MGRKSRKTKGLGLVLSGGAARSLAHIGVLSTLVEEKLPVAAIAAVSGGAIVGAAYAAGTSPAEAEKRALQLSWRKLTRLAFSRRALLGTDRLEALIREIVPAENFGDLDIPLKVVATDLANGERVVLSEGDLVSALLASCAIPGVFLPLERQGRLLVDGGVSCNLPTDVAREMGVKVVLAVDATKGMNRLGKSLNLLQVATQSVYVMSRQLTRHYLDLADLVVAPPMEGVSWEDLDRAAEIIESGRRQMRRQLPVLREMLQPAGLRQKLGQWLRAGRRPRSHEAGS